MTAEKPKQRKGFVLTAVWWGKNGRITRTKYEPVAKPGRENAAPGNNLVGSPGECSDCGRPGPAFQPCRYCAKGEPRIGRGVAAVAAQTDLFG